MSVCVCVGSRCSSSTEKVFSQQLRCPCCTPLLCLLCFPKAAPTKMAVHRFFVGKCPLLEWRTLLSAAELYMLLLSCCVFTVLLKGSSH
jgi:hypothetical protein